MADLTIIEQSGQTLDTSTPMTSKESIYINDQNNGFYSNSFRVETSSLANSGKLISLSESEIIIPLVVTLRGVDTTKAINETYNNFKYALKSNTINLIDLLRLCRGKEKMFRVTHYPTKNLWYEYNLKPTFTYVINASHILCLKNFKTGQIIEKTAQDVYNDDLIYQVEFGGYNAKHDTIYKITCIPYDICEREYNYFGFQCDGNERFCLEDYTVTHNSGKTNTILNVLQKLGDCFHHLVICVKSIQEPLYQYLLEKIPEEKAEVHEDSVVDIKQFEDKKWKDKSIAIIYDDLVTEKHLHHQITQASIRARKIAGGVSMFFLSQSYYQVPKSIRLQCQYIILKKIGSTKDLKEILKDHQINKNLSELQEIYEYATQDKFDFLLIDNESEPEEQLKKNFMEIIE